jgi:hypothetical protein
MNHVCSTKGCGIVDDASEFVGGREYIFEDEQSRVNGNLFIRANDSILPFLHMSVQSSTLRKEEHLSLSTTCIVVASSLGWLTARIGLVLRVRTGLIGSGCRGLAA